MTSVIPEIVCPLQKQHSSTGDDPSYSDEEEPSSPSFSVVSSDDESDFGLPSGEEDNKRQIYSPPCPNIHQQTHHHVNLQDKSGKSLLIHSCARGLKNTVEELSLDQNIDVNLEDIEGNTALIHASQAGHSLIVELLIERFANLEIDHVNKLGQTALIKAAIQGRGNCARILLKAGSDPYRRDCGRQLTALEWAEFVGRTECAKVIAEFMEPKRRGKKSLQVKAEDNFKQVACLAAIPLISGSAGGEVTALTRPRVRSAPPTPTVKIKITPPSSPFWNNMSNHHHSSMGSQQFPLTRAIAHHHQNQSKYQRTSPQQPSSSKRRPLQKYEPHHPRPKSSAS